MTRKLSEKQVLKKLDIPDFRHMTKEKTVTLVSMMDRLDPAVAIKAVEQFPELAGMLVTGYKEHQQAQARASDSNDASNKQAMDTIDKAVEIISGQLEQDDLTPEERTQLMQNFMSLVREQSRKDSENKNFNLKLVGMASLTLVSLAALAVAALGVNAQVTDTDADDDSEE